MTTPDSNPHEPSKMRKITSSPEVESIHARLPHRDDHVHAEESETVTSKDPSPAPRPVVVERRWRFMPAFWTIASVLSMIINLGLITLVLLLFQMRNRAPEFQSLAMDQGSRLLGGLYTNFVKMDEANIRTNIHIEEQIPVEFTLNVSGPTTVELTQPVTIRGATVFVTTGGLTIRDANATIVLPAGVDLPINIENLLVPVNQNVPAVLDVPVDIPLNQTELHEPFVGLQEVVRPWYCLIQPSASIDGRPVCAPGQPAAIDPTLLDPTQRTPAPQETVVP